jgi:hypothetical protein
MALKKAEMESHQAEYHALISQTRLALQEGLYAKAVELASSSWDFIDGMMQYERKYEGKEFDSVEGIDIVLEFAPLLFNFQSLDKLELLLKSQRRIDKHASDDLADRLSKARTRMWEAHRLWNHLERVSESNQEEFCSELGGDQTVWRTIAETWEEMGLIRRTPDGRSHRVALKTRMDEPVVAKCPSCAAIAKARKAKLLEEVTCPKCERAVVFVILANQRTTGK